MGRVRQLGWKVLGVLFLAGCSSTALLDAPDDMAGPGSGQGGGGVESACHACFDTNCAWEVTECAGDPECAHWLTCARDVPASYEGTADASWLEQTCGALSTASGRSSQRQLEACLTTKPCCAGALNGGTEPPGTSGAGGDTGPAPTYNDDGGVGNGGTGGDSEGAWDCGNGGVDCTCLSCLKTIGNASDLNPASCDPQDVTACLNHDGCHAFLVAFADCADTANANASASTTGTFEACLFEKVGNGTKLVEAAAMFMATVLPCAWSACGNSCVLETARPCTRCQSTSCTSELDAFVGDSNAFLYRWCRSYCDANGSEAACLDQCKTYKAAAQETLTIYGACVTNSCSDVCL